MHALLSDPGGTSAPGHLRRFGAAFRHYYDVGSHNTPLSGLHHTAYTLAVYASPLGLPLSCARLASGCWPALPGGTGYPLGSTAKFQRWFLSSSLPRLPWRTIIQVKLIRDGYEDYEYLKLLADRGQRDRARAIARELFPNMYTTDQSDRQVQAARLQLARLVPPDGNFRPTMASHGPPSPSPH